MITFSPGDLVMFTLGPANYIGTVLGVPKPGYSADYSVATPSGNCWFVPAEEMTPLLPGTPVFRAGQQVRVADDAPFHAGCVASVGCPEFQGVLFGYRLHLAGGSGTAWAPAGALKPMVGELR